MRNSIFICKSQLGSSLHTDTFVMLAPLCREKELSSNACKGPSASAVLMLTSHPTLMASSERESFAVAQASFLCSDVSAIASRCAQVFIAREKHRKDSEA